MVTSLTERKNHKHTWNKLLLSDFFFKSLFKKRRTLLKYMNEFLFYGIFFFLKAHDVLPKHTTNTECSRKRC